MQRLYARGKLIHAPACARPLHCALEAPRVDGAEVERRLLRTDQVLLRGAADSRRHSFGFRRIRRIFKFGAASIFLGLLPSFNLRLRLPQLLRVYAFACVPLPGISRRLRIEVAQLPSNGRTCRKAKGKQVSPHALDAYDRRFNSPPPHCSRVGQNDNCHAPLSVAETLLPAVTISLALTSSVVGAGIAAWPRFHLIQPLQPVAR